MNPRYVTSSDGSKIAFETQGIGAPLILVHGASGDRHSNVDLKKRLQEKFAVTSYDRRGRTDSTDEGDHSFLAEADDLRAVIATASTPPVVFGISMGGRIALELLRDPPKLAHMVLFEPPLTDKPDPEFVAKLGDVRNTLDCKSTEAATIQHSTLFHGRSDDEIRALQKDQKNWALRTATFPITLREMEAVHRDCLFETSQYQKPDFNVHALFGDRTIPFLTASHHVLTALDFINFVTLPGQNHSAPTQQPDLVANSVLSIASGH